MTGMEKGDILLYRFTRYSGQPRRRPGGRALPALWQAGGIHLPERGTGNFLEDEKVASPHLDSRPSTEFTLSLVERAQDTPFDRARDMLSRE